MNNIKRIRKEQNISQKELANLVNISAGYLSHLEKGSRNNPSIIVLKNIAKVLNTTIEELL